MPSGVATGWAGRRARAHRGTKPEPHPAVIRVVTLGAGKAEVNRSMVRGTVGTGSRAPAGAVELLGWTRARVWIDLPQHTMPAP